MTTKLLPPIDVDKLRWDSIPVQWRQQFNALLHDEEFIGAANPRDQVGIVCRTLRGNEDEPHAPLSVIADFFGIRPDTKQLPPLNRCRLVVGGPCSISRGQ
jgi:hypothetical protein